MVGSRSGDVRGDALGEAMVERPALALLEAGLAIVPDVDLHVVQCAPHCPFVNFNYRAAGYLNALTVVEL